MNKIKLLGALGILLLALSQVKAQDTFTLVPKGRILMDAGVLDTKNGNFGDGVAIPDLRLGVKATYGEYDARIDVGFANGAVSLKDIYIERKFSPSSLLRAGYFVHQFGLQSATSSSMKITMEEPTSNEAFFNSRLVGAMYIYSQNDFFATASAFAEGDAMTRSADVMEKQGYGAMSRLVYRPFRDEGKIFHVGLSGAFETPRYNNDTDLNHKSFTLGANFPSKIAKVKAVNASVDNAKNLVKFTPELLVGYGPVALETQYYNVNINRESSFSNYNASGGYAIVRGLIKGGNYTYSNSDSGIATPGPGSLECVVGYSYSDLSDAGIHGGYLNDLSLTFNYHINKYMIWRLRYSYADVSDAKQGVVPNPEQTLNAIQTRLQIIF
jgi:phosphate-selective porin OprO/OprP